MSFEKKPRNWYHGLLTRNEAESILKLNGYGEGLFLIRESSSAAGDFVLSVVHDNSVIHYQVRRRGEDALFSLSEEKKVIHGLDELVYYYQFQPNSGLQHSLTHFVLGTECPAAVKLHGVENLLHRASAGGSLPVVSELLKCGDRDVRAKNHDGQTALHLAAFYGHEDVVIELINYGASVNAADSSGYSPLHVACQANKAAVVQILLDFGSANPTIRNQITGWVPLHEAAWKGHQDCAVVLLNWDSPSMPRTPKSETPSDLARANGQNEMATLLDTWPVYLPITSSVSWLHSDIDRIKANQLLSDYGSDDGTFLVRESKKKKNTFVLSMCCEKKHFHFEIEKRGIYYFMDQGPYMPSLEHLIDHYTRFADGLPCSLISPVGKMSMPQIQRPDKFKSQFKAPTPPRHIPKPSVSVSQDEDSADDNSNLVTTPTTSSSDLENNNPCPGPPPRIPTRARIPLKPPQNLKPIDRKKIYENNETLRRVRHSRDNIPRDSIHLIQMIGEGEFGSVHKGLYMTDEGNVRPVAVKVLNDVDEEQTKDFVQEASCMMNLDHQCIVQLIGVSSGPPVLMILELVPLGSMLEFLTDHPESVRVDMEIPLWAAQIACGMMYLEKNRFIHRDLAARNILLASKLQAKISDFGLSRIVSSEKDYYRASKGGRWPIKWYAPECVNYGTFSHASDVWSYGVLLWEMYTYGQQPYNGLTGAEVVDFIESGKRLQRPDKAELEVFSTMEWCWEYSPAKRPKFSELFKIFSDNPEYSNLKELLLTQDLQKLGM